MRPGKVIVIGLDGFAPPIAEAMLARGELPHLAAIARTGIYSRLTTTLPAQTPVAWSSFAVGANPGAHGIFDFLHRDPETYRPDIALFGYERRNRFLPPRAVNRRGGTPLWMRLSEAGVPSVVLRHPCTYPPESPRGRMLAGVGVPDIRGGFGTPSFYTTAADEQARESEHVVVVRADGAGAVVAPLLGPRGPRGEDLTLELRIETDAEAGSARIACDGGAAVVVAQGHWSDWLAVRFRAGALQSVRGQVRFHLLGFEPLRLYASPVHFDPDLPVFPISHPWDYASELRREIGRYHTLGMAEEHTGLNNGRIPESAFLAQCDDVLRERRAMMHHELERLDHGFFYCLYDTPDRIQHMFWRFTEPEHPANRGVAPPAEMAGVIESHYRACDAIVGEALEYADERTLFVVASDHGFNAFRRQLHVNAWLQRRGYLSLQAGVEPGAAAGDLLQHVDWSRTRAYALGLAGVFLNLRGREAEGIVPAAEADALKSGIARELAELQDPDGGARVVSSVRGRESVYAGPYLEEAPDLLVSCMPGYRISSATALGGVPAQLVEDNLERWSGDHVVEPAAVPGVLFANRALRTDSPRIIDLAPTILDALGAPAGEGMEGVSLIP